jgi:hypothetical protein
LHIECQHPTQAKVRLEPDFLYAGPSSCACAPFIEESRMNFINANNLHRKSGAWGTQPLLPVK